MSRPRFESSIDERWALAGGFFAAIQDGDTDGLASLLAEDVALYADGSGRASAQPKPVHGAFEAAGFLADLGRRFLVEQISLVLADVNGQPDAITRDSSDGCFRPSPST